MSRALANFSGVSQWSVEAAVVAHRSGSNDGGCSTYPIQLQKAFEAARL
jgi:hypothetical protein